jgi:Na+(H+)/acetate symporter ActP
MLGIDRAGWLGAVLTQPAAITVPVAFAVMIVVSVLTRSHRPPHLAQTMVRLHAPEHLGLDRGSFHPEGSTARR